MLPRTPFPKYLLDFLSLNSIASCMPVDAPEGTEALAVIPFLSIISVRSVGIPLLSRIS